MNSIRKALAVFLALGFTSACDARQPSPDWNGTWKMNLSKSSYQNLGVTISISAAGEYGYDDGRSSFTFRCDGKDRPIGKNRAEACVKSNTTTLDLTQKENGAKTNAYHWELSADGNVLTATATAFRPSGPVTTSYYQTGRRFSNLRF
jgi:hypothetical protein